MARRILFTDQQLAAMTARYRAGQSAEAIALVVGCSRGTVLRALHAQSVALRRAGFPLRKTP
jgi:DNA-directed RNA polymerase specialized sigma24 family protein